MCFRRGRYIEISCRRLSLKATSLHRSCDYDGPTVRSLSDMHPAATAIARTPNAEQQEEASGVNRHSNRACSQGLPGSAMCVQRFDDSLNSAIRITYRISLRSSSLREPRYPLLKVVLHCMLCAEIPRDAPTFRFRYMWCCMVVKEGFIESCCMTMRLLYSPQGV